MEQSDQTSGKPAGGALPGAAVVERTAPYDVEGQGPGGGRRGRLGRARALLARARPYSRAATYTFAVGLEAAGVWSDWQFLGSMMLPCWSQYRVVLGEVYSDRAVWFRWMSVAAAVVSLAAFLARAAACALAVARRPPGTPLRECVGEVYDREDARLHSPRPNARQLLTFVSSTCSDGFQLAVTVAILTVNPSGALVFAKAGLSAAALGSNYVRVATIFLLWALGCSRRFKLKEKWPQSVPFKAYCCTVSAAVALFLLLGMYNNQGSMKTSKPFEAHVLRAQLCGSYPPSQCQDVTPSGNATALVAQRKIAQLSLAGGAAFPNFGIEQGDSAPYPLNGFERLYTNRETATLQNVFTCPADAAAPYGAERCAVVAAADPEYKMTNGTMSLNYYLNVTLRAEPSSTCFP